MSKNDNSEINSKKRAKNASFELKKVKMLIRNT